MPVTKQVTVLDVKLCRGKPQGERLQPANAPRIDHTHPLPMSSPYTASRSPRSLISLKHFQLGTKLQTLSNKGDIASAHNFCVLVCAWKGWTVNSLLYGFVPLLQS